MRNNGTVRFVERTEFHSSGVISSRVFLLVVPLFRMRQCISLWFSVILSAKLATPSMVERSDLIISYWFEYSLLSSVFRVAAASPEEA